MINEKTLIRDHITQEIKDMNERKNKVSQELSAPEYELKKKLFDMKPYVDALTGFTPEHEENTKVYKTKTIKTPADKKTFLDSRDQLIDQLENYFISEKRTYSRHAVANYLISTQQSFMTVIAGLPGVGKTSLVRLLTNGLGVSARLLEVAVGRGWSSSRDLVGYFNPLTGKFQGSPTGFYDFLKQTHEDIVDEDANAFVLLDEANLSPIEHYWSSFMGISDNPDRGRLRLGNEVYDISKNVRFIATINYDTTTEPLSPRMIDRCPIIVLGESESELESEPSEVLAAQTGLVYPGSVMEEWFGNPTAEMALNPNDVRILEELIQATTSSTAANGKPIILSARKRDAIVRYCKRAYPIMRTERDNLAIDYAVAQHVLPLINGQGEMYRNRIVGIQTILEKYHLDISSKLITRILESGKQDLDSYNFFSW